MQSHYSASHVVIVHMPKAALLHEGFEFLLTGVHPNGLGQITVAGVIACHHLAQLGQDFEGIPVVNLLQRLGHFGEFQHQQFARRV